MELKVKLQEDIRLKQLVVLQLVNTNIYGIHMENHKKVKKFLKLKELQELNLNKNI
jgi:hypothetical protein